MSWYCIFCSTENDDSANACSLCGVHRVATSGGDKELSLLELNNNVSVKINKESYVVGRCCQDSFSFLSQDDYLSNMHFRVYKENGEWYIEHLSHTNPTLINEITVDRNMPLHLHNNDTIEAGLSCFRAIITQQAILQGNTPATAANSDASCITATAAEQTEPPAEEYKYVIRCPICGKDYTVENESSTINECTSESCKDDDFDKYRIARIHAVRTRLNAD